MGTWAQAIHTWAHGNRQYTHGHMGTWEHGQAIQGLANYSKRTAQCDSTTALNRHTNSRTMRCKLWQKCAWQVRCGLAKLINMLCVLIFMHCMLCPLPLAIACLAQAGTGWQTLQRACVLVLSLIQALLKSMHRSRTLP